MGRAPVPRQGRNGKNQSGSAHQERELSVEEYSILDELNGLVMAGEIALERLQRAGEARVAAEGRVFRSHYDLAAHLLNAAGATLRGPEANTAIGRVDLLFELLSQLD